MSGERLRVAVAGAGGMGREALAWLRDARPDVDPVAFFVADTAERPAGKAVDLEVVTSFGELASLGVSAVALAIGEAVDRSRVAGEIERAALALVTIVHPTAFIGPGVVLGHGAIVAPGAVITRDVGLGNASIVNYRAAVGHDCEVGDFAFIGPGAVLAGDVSVGRESMIGAGAVVLPGRAIGERATVGAGAVVTRNVSAECVVAGNPARQISLLNNGSDRV